MIILDVIASLTIGPLLMYWWMNHRLERYITAAKRSAEARLTEQRPRSARSFDLLASDYNNIRDDLRQAAALCEGLAVEKERLAGHIAQLSTENDALRHRLTQTPAVVNAWGPKTDRGQA